MEGDKTEKEFIMIFIILYLKIVMKCPYCNVDFHPRMNKNNVGYDLSGKVYYDVYYQLCPECSRPVIGIFSYFLPENSYVDEKELENKLTLLK